MLSLEFYACEQVCYGFLKTVFQTMLAQNLINVQPHTPP